MSGTQTISDEDISPHGKLCDWLQKLERGGLLVKQNNNNGNNNNNNNNNNDNNNKCKIHSFISDAKFSPLKFHKALGSLWKFLMEGAHLAKEASIDHSNTFSNERVYNSIMLKEASSMYYPSPVKETVLVEKAPLVHNNPFLVSRHYEAMKDFPYNISIIRGQCQIQSSSKNEEQWEVILGKERADKKLRTDLKIRDDLKIRVTPRNRKKNLSVDDPEIKNTVSAIELFQIKSPPTKKCETMNDFQYSHMLHMMTTGCPIQNISFREQWYTDLSPIPNRGDGDKQVE